MDKRQLFAKRLRELRKSKGLTQKELGRRLNVTEAAVGMWEQ
ncbi:MAG: helix-turn-helix transcriptional regulator, partial [Firmicutes bacterium]|nr:helix-turn-helix transcriptional regulator [Bacillota bacterium]